MPEAIIFNGVDGVTPPDKVAQDEAAAASNVDFSLYPGAAAIRRGSVRIVKPSTSQIEVLYRHYSEAAYGSAPWYASDSSGAIYRITGGFGSPSASSIASGGVTSENDLTAFASWRDDVFIASGPVGIRDDGSSDRAWVPPAPASAVTLTTATLTPVTVTSTYGIVEGSGSHASGTATATVDASTFRAVLTQAPTTNLNVNGTNTIGDYGVHSVEIALSEPKNLTRVLIEYSIGDITFTNKLVAQLKATDILDAAPDPDVLIDGLLEEESGVPVRSRTAATVRGLVRREFRPTGAQAGAETTSFTTWAVPVTNLRFVGRASAADLTNVQQCRLIIEATSDLVATIRNWVVQGAETYSLNDPYVGYSYWETFARVETIGGIQAIVDESAPSPASARTKAINAAMVVVSGNASPGEGMTHRVLYRQGGYMRDAYAVSTHAVATATVTDTIPDIAALARGDAMLRDIRAALPQAVRAAVAHRERMFVGYDNIVAWSLPGRPGTFPKSSEASVSHTADRIQSLQVHGDNLVIVNRDSVYELTGSIFEGASADWTLQRSGAKGGSVAARATVRTPFGILLVREQGLFLYQPGVGVDRPIEWATARMGDVFKGNGAFDPAQKKGSRVGSGMNQAALSHCVAAWHDDKLWFGFGDASATRPNRFAVLDFLRQRVWFYTFPWSVRSLWADRDSNALIAATTDGALMRLNIGHNDQTTSGVASSITWSLLTRQWVVDGNLTAQSVRVDNEGLNNGVLSAVYDGTSTAALGTLSADARDWEQFALDGSNASAVQFALSGTQASADQGVIHRIEWGGLFDPPAVSFLSDDEDDAGWQCEKIWDGVTAEMQVVGTGTVTAVTYIDGTAVQTNTTVGPHARTLLHWSLPHDTLGDVAFTTYTGGSSDVEFRFWPKTRYTARREPCRVNAYKTDLDSGEERLFDAFDVDVDPNGTVTSSFYLDGALIGAYTSVGTNGRQSFAHALPQDTYGRTAFVCHNGTLFKHYRTWYHTRPEPDRLSRWQYGPVTYDTEQLFRTVVCDVNPLGTATAIVQIDGVAVETATFTGLTRQTFEIGLDLTGGNAARTGRKIEVDIGAVGAGAKLKHYDTKVESTNKPFGKDTWIVDYTKIGGASRLDLAVAQSMDVEVVDNGTATVTSIWDVDNVAVATTTLTFVGRQYLDRQLLPPGMRGYIFRQRVRASAPVQVWSSRIEVQPVGVKGAIHRALSGTPR